MELTRKMISKWNGEIEEMAREIVFKDHYDSVSKAVRELIIQRWNEIQREKQDDYISRNTSKA